MPNFLTITCNPLVTVEGAAVLRSAALLAANALATGVKPPYIKLYQNDPAITVDTVIGDLEECTATLVDQDFESILEAFEGPNGTPMLVQEFEAFVADDPLTTPGIAQGVYVTNFAKTLLIAAFRFPEAFAFSDPGDQVNVAVQIQFPGWAALVSP